jgi:hypothetical protein
LLYALMPGLHINVFNMARPGYDFNPILAHQYLVASASVEGRGLSVYTTTGLDPADLSPWLDGGGDPATVHRCKACMGPYSIMAREKDVKVGLAFGLTIGDLSEFTTAKGVILDPHTPLFRVNWLVLETSVYNSMSCRRIGYTVAQSGRMAFILSAFDDRLIVSPPPFMPPCLISAHGTACTLDSDEPHEGTACLWAVKKAAGGTECSWDYNAITDDAGDEKLKILCTCKGENYACGDVPLVPLMSCSPVFVACPRSIIRLVKFL